MMRTNRIRRLIVGVFKIAWTVRERPSESFKNRLPEECLTMELVDSNLHVRSIIAAWQNPYNQGHRRSSLGYLSPFESAAKLT